MISLLVILPIVALIVAIFMIRNVRVIFRKEMRSYFAAPVAYLLLAMFVLIFGFFFWHTLGCWVCQGRAAMRRGQPLPMDTKPVSIPPLLPTAATMRLSFS